MKKTMTSKQLETFILKQLDDAKALDVVSLKISPLTTIADYMLICSGTSSRHVMSMAENLAAKAKEKGVTVLGIEHDPTGNWTLVDLGDAIVNIMLPKTRELYSLEKLWDPKPAAKEPAKAKTKPKAKTKNKVKAEVKTKAKTTTKKKAPAAKKTIAKKSSKKVK